MEGLELQAGCPRHRQGLPRPRPSGRDGLLERLPQFTYTKFVVVVDRSINIRDPAQVIWAISAQGGSPAGHLFVLEDTPVRFTLISPASGWAWRQAAIDATTKQSVGEAPRLGRTGLSRPASWRPISMALGEWAWPTSMPAIPIRCYLVNTALEHVLEGSAPALPRSKFGPRPNFPPPPRQYNIYSFFCATVIKIVHNA